MNRRAVPAIAYALLIAASIACAAAAPLPARPGDSVLYHYDITGAQPSGGQLWVIRGTAGQVTVTVSPAEDQNVPGTYAFAVASDGVLSGGAADGSSGSAGGPAAEMARSFAVAANLLASIAAPSGADSWNVDVPVPGTAGAMRLLARVASVSGTDRTVVADGSGVLNLVPLGSQQGRRRGPQASPTPVTLDVEMHVQASLRRGILSEAQGLTRTAPHGQTKNPTTHQYSWTITAQ